ncbi:MAG: primosomal protein N' [Thermodesulfobacteriota bacterium]
MTEQGTLIDVAVPLPIEGLFTYGVPAHLTSQIELGRRVLVPFGKKIRAGFLIGLSNGLPATLQIKDVIDIPDEPPYLTEGLWRLIRWMAEYYLLPTGLVLKTALPSGSDRKSQPWALLTPDGRRWFGTVDRDKGLILPAKMLKSGAMPKKELLEILGHEGLRKALDRQWVRMEERIARPRTSLFKRTLHELLDPAGVGSHDLETPPPLTEDQATAFGPIREAVAEGGYRPFLLFGVTGSGKTEVYLRAIDQTLTMGKKALVLVPEIALTPQLARRFLRRLGGGVALFHSGLTPAQRLDEWRRIRLGTVRVVIAARSGIFVPMENLGLIVVDEEHDPSYKQEDSCPYHARDMALARAKLEGACVILGSATPSFESFVNAMRGKITRLDLRARHHGGSLPSVEVVDLREEGKKTRRGSLLTPRLLQAVGEALDRKEQVVIFLNRRGFDTFAQCRSCGTALKCPNCDVSLIHHKKARDLRCHICGYSRMAPPLCPSCAGDKIFFGGVGTQKVEEDLVEAFPQARVERLDRDSTRRREDLEAILDRFRHREIDILTGTQMIVKGHDFPGISLVGILCGDHSLHFPDFRASERTFQMLTQVAGRTGRESDSGHVILQTFDPDHTAIRLASTHAYEEFFRTDAALREELAYPPYGHLILIRVEGNDESRVEKKAHRIATAARMLKGDCRETMVLGPAPAPRRKVIGRFRWQILLKGTSRGPVRNLTKGLMAEGHLKGHGYKIIVDVDPVDLM